MDIWIFVRWTCKNYAFESLLLGFSVDSILGVKYDLVLVLRSQFFEYLRETLYKHALKHLEVAFPEKRMGKKGFPYGNTWLLLTSLKACDWSGHIFGASASLGSLAKKNWPRMSPSSTVHGGQHDTKYVTFELLLHAAFIRGWRNLGFYAWTSSCLDFFAIYFWVFSVSHSVTR